MPVVIHALGLITGHAGLPWWLAREMARLALPWAQKLMEDPSGAVSRVGDALVWQGPGGREMIAGLEGLSESQARIERVVGNIEQAQIGLADGLGTLTSLSMATLGLGALGAGFMLHRLNALDKRLDGIGHQLADIQAALTAQNRAHLGTALQHLQFFEDKRIPADLQCAKNASTHATELYRGMVQGEVNGRRRLLALNQCGRYYLMALTAQLRCLVLEGSLEMASKRIDAERPAMTDLAAATLRRVLGQSPAVYLDPGFRDFQVTLELLAEIYQQARQAGVEVEVEEPTPARLFEHLRPRVGKDRPSAGLFASGKAAKVALLNDLKYLMACLEEVNRIQGFGLRIEHAIKHDYSFRELEELIKPMREKVPLPSEDETGVHVLAYAVA